MRRQKMRDAMGHREEKEKKRYSLQDKHRSKEMGEDITSSTSRNEHI